MIQPENESMSMDKISGSPAGDGSAAVDTTHMHMNGSTDVGAGMAGSRSRTLRRVLGVAAFAGIAVWILIHVAYVLRPTTFDNSRFVWPGLYAEQKDTLDVITVGSSEIYRFIDTPCLYEQTGITSYNLSCPMMLSEVFKYALEESLNYQHPALYVIGVRTFIFEEEDEEYKSIGLHRMTDNMDFFSLVRWKMIFNLVDSWEDRIDYLFDILTYHSDWDNLSWRHRRYFFNRYLRPMKAWTNILLVEEQDPEADFLGETEDLPLTEANEQHLIDLLEYCQEQELNVLFVNTPWITTEEDRGLSQTAIRIIESYGYPVLDLNTAEAKEEMGLDYATDFYNERHVNVWGAEKVTKLLGDYLTGNYDLPLEHSEAVIAEWAETTTVYDRKIANAQAKKVENAEEEEADTEDSTEDAEA